MRIRHNFLFFDLTLKFNYDEICPRREKKVVDDGIRTRKNWSRSANEATVLLRLLPALEDTFAGVVLEVD